MDAPPCERNYISITIAAPWVRYSAGVVKDAGVLRQAGAEPPGGRGGEKRGRELASLIPYEVVYPFDQELDNILGLRLRPYLGAIRFPDREPEACPCREWFEGILRC